MKNEELTCIQLHLANTKELHNLFMTDLKPFFDFRNKCLNVGLEATYIAEDASVPSKLCAFPMDMSAK